jgi:hypothetical protein
MYAISPWFHSPNGRVMMGIGSSSPGMRNSKVTVFATNGISVRLDENFDRLAESLEGGRLLASAILGYRCPTKKVEKLP